MKDDGDPTESILNVVIGRGPNEVVISTASPAGDLNQICQIPAQFLQDVLLLPRRNATAFHEQLHDLPLQIAMAIKRLMTTRM